MVEPHLATSMRFGLFFLKLQWLTSYDMVEYKLIVYFFVEGKVENEDISWSYDTSTLFLGLITKNALNRILQLLKASIYYQRGF